MVDTFAFRFFLLLHILSVVVAFAPTVVALLPGNRGTAVDTVRRYYSPALILAGLFGILCVLTSEDVFEFDQTWISLAFLVWIAMIGVQHAIVLPGRRVGSLNKVDGGQAIITVLLVIMLYLMIWKPGWP
ncbi:MAG TPA: hypothetical protein VIL48_22650 [Acidimicrobiales bacterium]